MSKEGKHDNSMAKEPAGGLNKRSNSLGCGNREEVNKW